MDRSGSKRRRNENDSIVVRRVRGKFGISLSDGSFQPLRLETPASVDPGGWYFVWNPLLKRWFLKLGSDFDPKESTALLRFRVANLVYVVCRDPIRTKLAYKINDDLDVAIDLHGNTSGTANCRRYTFRPLVPGVWQDVLSKREYEIAIDGDHLVARDPQTGAPFDDVTFHPIPDAWYVVRDGDVVPLVPPLAKRIAPTVLPSKRPMNADDASGREKRRAVSAPEAAQYPIPARAPVREQRGRENANNVKGREKRRIVSEPERRKRGLRTAGGRIIRPRPGVRRRSGGNGANATSTMNTGSNSGNHNRNKNKNQNPGTATRTANGGNATSSTPAPNANRNAASGGNAANNSARRRSPQSINNLRSPQTMNENRGTSASENERRRASGNPHGANATSTMNTGSNSGNHNRNQNQNQNPGTATRTANNRNAAGSSRDQNPHPTYDNFHNIHLNLGNVPVGGRPNPAAAANDAMPTPNDIAANRGTCTDFATFRHTRAAPVCTPMDLASPQFPACLAAKLGAERDAIRHMKARLLAEGRQHCPTGADQAASLALHQQTVQAIARMFAAYDPRTQLGGHRGLLVLHSTGSGKTLTSLAIMLAFLHTPHQIVLASTIENLEKNAPKVYGNYLLKFFPEIASGQFPGQTAAQIGECILSGYPKIDAHPARVLRLSLDMLDNALDGRFQKYRMIGFPSKAVLEGTARTPHPRKKLILIIDEVQNLLEREGRKNALKWLLTKGNVNDVIVFALTATPGATANEWAKIMNLVRPVGRPMFTAEDMYRPSTTFDGLVSYVNTAKDPTLVAELREVDPAHTTIAMTVVYFFAFLMYWKSMKKSREFDFDVSRSQAFYLNLKRASCFLYKHQMQGLPTHAQTLLQKLALRVPSGNTVLDVFISPKLMVLLRFIRHTPGKHFVYTTSCQAVLGAWLHDNGFYRAIGKHTTPKNRFMYVGDPYKGVVQRAEEQNADTEQDLLETFNSPQNKHGEIIRVIIATGQMFEGVDAKGIRYLHIVEPMATCLHERQLIGRALRACGHSNLNASDRNVEVLRWASSMPRDFKKFMEGEMPKPLALVELAKNLVAKLSNVPVSAVNDKNPYVKSIASIIFEAKKRAITSPDSAVPMPDAIVDDKRGKHPGEADVMGIETRLQRAAIDYALLHDPNSGLYRARNTRNARDANSCGIEIRRVAAPSYILDLKRAIEGPATDAPPNTPNARNARNAHTPNARNARNAHTPSARNAHTPIARNAHTPSARAVPTVPVVDTRARLNTLRPNEWRSSRENTLNFAVAFAHAMETNKQFNAAHIKSKLQRGLSPQAYSNKLERPIHIFEKYGDAYKLANEIAPDRAHHAASQSPLRILRVGPNTYRALLPPANTVYR